ncbi:hypothetical protein NYE69_28225 [Paenibacillus sp. FSL R5-0527]|uniref:hypothetical protein n=1 Tax=Paenibacillus sp. FSL R5-0527 TaxID=2975321 RepID=UPI00097ACFE1|nr:hypothetical protein BK140_11180 [Paenibacillus macerans]
MDFYDENNQALRQVSVVVRDSLGDLAIQLLCARQDITKLDYHELIIELSNIVKDLHSAYEHEYHRLD